MFVCVCVRVRVRLCVWHGASLCHDSWRGRQEEASALLGSSVFAFEGPDEKQLTKAFELMGIKVKKEKNLGAGKNAARGGAQRVLPEGTLERARFVQKELLTLRGQAHKYRDRLT